MTAIESKSTFLVVGMTVLALTLGAKSSDAALILLEDDSVAVEIAGVANFATTGALMDGMEATATFTDGFTETEIWGATGAESGGVLGSDWDLEVDGDTFLLGTEWIFSNGRNAGLASLVLDGAPGLTMFDRTFGGATGTPDSVFGTDLFVIAPDTNGIDVIGTYSSLLNLPGDAAVRDIWQVLSIDFGTAGARGEIRFEVDTDNDIRRSVVPEPGTSLLLAFGLLALARRRRTS